MPDVTGQQLHSSLSMGSMLDNHPPLGSHGHCPANNNRPKQGIIQMLAKRYAHTYIQK